MWQIVCRQRLKQRRWCNAHPAAGCMPFPSPIAHRASEHARFKTSAVVRGGGEQTIIKLCFKCATVRAGCKDGQSCCSHFRARQYPPQDAVPHVAWLAVDRVGPCANLSPCPQAATTAACLRVPVRQTAPVSCKRACQRALAILLWRWYLLLFISDFPSQLLPFFLCCPFFLILLFSMLRVLQQDTLTQRTVEKTRPHTGPQLTELHRR